VWHIEFHNTMAHTLRHTLCVTHTLSVCQTHRHTLCVTHSECVSDTQAYTLSVCACVSDTHSECVRHTDTHSEAHTEFHDTMAHSLSVCRTHRHTLWGTHPKWHIEFHKKLSSEDSDTTTVAHTVSECVSVLWKQNSHETRFGEAV